MTRSFKIFSIAITFSLIFSLISIPLLSQDLEFGGSSFLNEEELVQVKSLFSISQAAPGGNYKAVLIADISKGWHINSAAPYEDWLIAAKLDFATISGIKVNSVKYPKGEDGFVGEDKFSLYSGEAVFSFNVTIDNNLTPGEYKLPVTLTFQPCNDRECRAPESLTASLAIIVGPEGVPTHTEIFASLNTEENQPVQVASTTVADNEIQQLIDKHGIWGYFIALGLAFVTGLVLSFSPCTYPMIPITVSIFAGQNRSVGRGFFLSLFYVGSMATVYGLMGLVVALVGGVFGAWLASPPVVIGIAIVFVIFSLSMFGVYELNVPMSLRQKLGTAAKGDGGILGSIILGVIAALVVSPCVGPFVAGILLYVATSGSPFIGFIVLFVFAMGLGTLYIIIGTFSSTLNQLPGSGGWMETVKKFFGFILLLMAIYFLSTIISVTLVAILTGLLLLAFGVFGGGLDRLTPEAGFFLRLKKFIGLLALLIGIYLIAGVILTEGLILPPVSEILPAGTTTAVEKEKIQWEKDLNSGLALAKKTNKPVIIDTWATWCANCKVLDKKTFSNLAVIQESKRFVAIKAQLETADSPQTKIFMKKFNMKHYSLPTILILDSQGNVRKTIQGVIGPDDFIQELNKVT